MTSTSLSLAIAVFLVQATFASGREPVAITFDKPTDIKKFQPSGPSDGGSLSVVNKDGVPMLQVVVTEKNVDSPWVVNLPLHYVNRPGSIPFGPRFQIRMEIATPPGDSIPISLWTLPPDRKAAKAAELFISNGTLKIKGQETTEAALTGVMAAIDINIDLESNTFTLSLDGQRIVEDVSFIGSVDAEEIYLLQIGGRTAGPGELILHAINIQNIP